jgi:hypothetical protein
MTAPDQSASQSLQPGQAAPDLADARSVADHVALQADALQLDPYTAVRLVGWTRTLAVEVERLTDERNVWAQGYGRQDDELVALETERDALKAELARLRAAPVAVSYAAMEAAWPIIRKLGRPSPVQGMEEFVAFEGDYGNWYFLLMSALATPSPAQPGARAGDGKAPEPEKLALQLADTYANASFEQGLHQRIDDPKPEAAREKLVAEVRRLAAAPAVSAPVDCHLIEDAAIVLERRDEFGQTHKREAAALRAWSAGIGSALQRLHDLITDGDAPHWPNLPQTDLASRWYVTLCEAIEQECAALEAFQATVTGEQTR